MEKQFSIQFALMIAYTYMAPLLDFKMNIPKILAGAMEVLIIVGWLLILWLEEF